MSKFFKLVIAVALMFGMSSAKEMDQRIIEKPESFSGNFDARGNGVCMDEDGNIYVVGFITDTGDGKTFWLQKYKGLSREDWERTFSGKENKDDEGRGVTVDSEGSIIAAGYETIKGPKKSIFIKKWDKGGIEVWKKNVASENKADSVANAVAVDKAGNIYVAGYLGNKTDRPAAWLGYFEKSGTQVGQDLDEVGAEGKSEIKAILLDAAGNIYIAGNKLLKGLPAEGFVRKLGPDKKEVWKYTLNAPTKKEISFNALALDDKGNIYAAGFYDVPGSGKDALVKKLDKDGRDIMEIVYSNSSKFDDVFNGVAVDTAGNIYVCGYTTNLKTAQDSIMRKYNSAGKDQMTRIFDNNKKNDCANAICFSSDGSVIITGYLTVGSSETNLWIKKYNQ